MQVIRNTFVTLTKVGRGGALVEAITFNREGRGFNSRSSRHIGEPWASPLPAVVRALRRETPI